jgi:hypothetical protein
MKLQTIPHVSCFKPQGAFYLFPNMKAYYEKEFNGTPIRNSYGIAYFLLREATVAIVPGDSFGADDYVRLSFATSMENLNKGLERIGRALSELKPAKKAKRIALNNAVTHVKKPIPVDAAISDKVRDGLVSEVQAYLTHESYFEWNANINGVVVQLRTNVAHLNDFWTENWYPAQLESEPHGIIYAVDGIPGREPRAFYNTDTKTGVIVNCDHYGSLRSLAIGLVSDVSERLFGIHSVRGMSADMNGNGMILVGPAGTKKIELFFDLLRDSKFRFHANDAVFVRYSNNSALAHCVERKVYIPTNTVEEFARLAPLFDSSKCENVILRKEDCANSECLRQEDCRLDRGSPFCYKASKEAHGMLDPNWIGGPAACAKRTTLRWVFILRSDAISPAAADLSTDEALRILETGEIPGMQKGVSAGKNPPFFNPHLLVTTEDRLALQKSFFKKLLETAKFYLFNSGVAGAEKLKEIVGAG